jgi:predicted DNA-binding transcriptional regulator AlpA
MNGLRGLSCDNDSAETTHAIQSNSFRFLTVKEAAALLRVSEVTLGRWRIEGQGPQYCKLGRRVVYTCDDLIAWAETRKRFSTSERA